MLSVCVVTQDQAGQLGPLLANVSPVADEIVAVDGGSADATEALLRASPKVRYFRRDLDTIARQKSFALDQARGDWILVVDTDELLSDSLRDAIPGLLRTRCRSWFKLPRYWVVRRDPPLYVHSEAHYPDFQLRLFRNAPPFRYRADQPVHAHFPRQGRGRGKKLRGSCHIVHLDFLLNDRRKREEKVARYDRIDPAAHETNLMYLYEDLAHEIRPCGEPWPT